MTTALLGVLSLGGVSSLPVQVETADGDTTGVQGGADATVTVQDSPPSYADGTTLTPVTVVNEGETVRWEWEGGMRHSVTFDGDLSTGSQGFDSGIQRLDGDGDPFEFEVTFDEPGTYKYFCQVHLVQHGEVVVL